MVEQSVKLFSVFLVGISSSSRGRRAKRWVSLDLAAVLTSFCSLGSLCKFSNNPRKDANAGMLTNFEVLDLLRSRGATRDLLGTLGAVSPSECKVFDYLVQTAASNQTRENINECLKRSEKYNLTKGEKLNIVNLRPSSGAEIYPIIEECDERFQDELEELVEMVVDVLPPSPLKPGEIESKEIMEASTLVS